MFDGSSKLTYLQYQYYHQPRPELAQCPCNLQLRINSRKSCPGQVSPISNIPARSSPESFSSSESSAYSERKPVDDIEHPHVVERSKARHKVNNRYRPSSGLAVCRHKFRQVY